MQWRKLNEEFLECRNFGHARANAHLVAVDVDGHHHRGVETTCQRCGYKLVQVLDTHGSIVGYRRKYPDNYLVKGEGRADSSEGRLELVRRLRAPQRNFTPATTPANGNGRPRKRATSPRKATARAH